MSNLYDDIIGARLLYDDNDCHDLDIWMETHKTALKQICSMFDHNGIPIPDIITATTFNDYYKFPMSIIFAKIEKYFAPKNINVTFCLDIRDKEISELILNDKILQNRIILALDNLKLRKFRRDIFEMVQTKLCQLSDDIIDNICKNSTLIRDLSDSDIMPVYTIDEYKTTICTKPIIVQDNVVISCYIGQNAKSMIADEPSHKFYIEASGPWHLVTWLETSMMQCVYETVLRYENERLGRSYGEWLYGALLRCHKSVKVANGLPLRGALFSGRRTGGFVFALIQNYYLANSYHHCIGTSSVDAHFRLKMMFGNALQLVGTHAHELSMVFSALFSELDTEVPLSQILGHYMFYKLVGGPIMPMLPDTLGTRSFLVAAKTVSVTNKYGEYVKFIDVISSARQDSGNVEDFVKLVREFGYKSDIMASEVDNVETLITVAKLGYTTFGAGGFFGDSEKVWNKTSTFNGSMAVKAVRVCMDDQLLKHPVKLGDGQSIGKITADTTLPPDEYLHLINYAQDYRMKLSKMTSEIIEKMDFSDKFNLFANKIFVS